MSRRGQATRNLVLVLGDQLNRDSLAFDGFDARRDCAWMAESEGEASHVWSSKVRIAFFFAAMRHFGAVLEADGIPLDYHRLDESKKGLAELLSDALERHRPKAVVCCLPGEWRVLEALRQACSAADIPLEVRPDRHFLDSPEGFVAWATARKSVRLEYYYREMRKRHDILMTADGKPEGGSWNFDKDNRGCFGREGPDTLRPEVLKHVPDSQTKEVLGLVEERFSKHPGQLEHFHWPVTREQALASLDDFVENRLAAFGTYQDAMWTGEPFLYHSLVSAALNVKLLHPREVVAKAVAAYEDGRAPLNAVEGFVRQIMGWREYVRGVYWWKMPDYLELNGLSADQPLPEFYWTGETPYRCLSESIGQTLDYGYAHHIQRLMVTGLYGLLFGVRPKAMHEWYLAVYVDAVEWVELPNVLGMSQFADGGIMASKPYVATGKYIHRMSNYCAHCPMNPQERTGPDACPFTTLYWDFLLRNREKLAHNQRLQLQLRNLDRLSQEQVDAIRQAANAVRKNPSGERDVQ
jgi:deoxyribodipyrimidine photolyase-related protein